MKRRIPQRFERSGSSLSPLRFTSTAGSTIDINVIDSRTVRVQHVPPGRTPLPATHSVCVPTATTSHVGSNDARLPVLGTARSDVTARLSSRFGSMRPTATATAPVLAVSADGTRFTLSTADIDLVVDIANGDLTLSWHSRHSSKPFLQDLPFRAYEYDVEGTGSVHHNVRHSTDTSYYGAGERASPLSLSGRHLRLEALDALGYDPQRSDPLYKHVPAYYGISRSTFEAFGVYYDSLATGSMDFGCEIDALWGTYSTFKTHAPSLDYYVFLGPALDDCVQTLAALVGRPAMVPKYALGYLASSMGYAEAENAQQLIEAFPELCKKWDIPCDLLHLSSGYTVDPVTGGRNVFTWNATRFPDPARMFARLHSAGIKTVANIKPWLLSQHPLYASTLASKGFIWDPESDSASVTRLWSAGAGTTATGSYIDFSSTAGRDLWKSCVKKLLDLGVDGMWNDNNEFSLHDDDHVYSMLGQTPTPLQTVLMASASYEAMAEHSPAKRPFLITRSSAPGAHRFASQTWSGDNASSWETLQHNIPMGLNAGLSLMPGYGHDVGGFVGQRPGKELFVRWVQNGIFHPRFCIHSWKDEGITEPWMYPDVVHVVRDAMRLRYMLIPYLYTLHHQASATGVPVIRPLVYHFQSDPRVHEASFEFLLGSGLLVASVFTPTAAADILTSVATRTLYLPSSATLAEPTLWCDFWNGKWYTGGATISVPVPFAQHGAVFAVQGAMIPMAAPMRHVGAQPDSYRAVWVYPPHGKMATAQPPRRYEFVLVDDDGVTADASKFEARLWMETTTATTVTVGVDVLSNAFVPDYRDIVFVLPHGDTRDLVCHSSGAVQGVEPEGRRSLAVPVFAQ
ncbi:glycosyl hydrolases family 31-domain-containing protein [Entophlyctis helioformis]|nr:glycosyl hydrolases family 31-domain-containing protein [Entophlyctis helioformis]